MQAIEFGKHWIEHIGPLQVHFDTLITAWTAMALLIIFSVIATRKLSIIPSKLQVFSEMAMDFVEGIAKGQIGKDGQKHVPLIASLFLFILISNLLGQLPWKLIHLKEGEFASPTNDLNVTVALALIVSVYYISAGIFKKGLKHFKHYLEPVWFIAPLNVLEDFTRPLSLSIRLFANILAGEVIIMVLLSFVPLVLPVPMMLFELFVAFIQAFVFAVLAASYISAVTSEHH